MDSRELVKELGNGRAEGGKGRNRNLELRQGTGEGKGDLTRPGP